MNRIAILFVVLCISLVTSASNAHENLEKIYDNVQEKESNAVNQALMTRVAATAANQFLEKITVGEEDPIVMPNLPLIAAGSISMSISQIEIGGFKTIMPIVSAAGLVPITEQMTIGIKWPNIHMHAGHYVAGGFFAHLPVAGESTLNVTVAGISGTVTYDKVVDGKFYKLCAVPGTTKFLVDIERLIVKFYDLNPGLDSGEVVNSMISSINTDIAIMITEFLNHGDVYTKLDNVIVKAINGLLNKFSAEDEPICDVQTESETISPEEIKELVKEALVSRGEASAAVHLVADLILDYMSEMENSDDADAVISVLEDVVEIFDKF